MSKNTNNISEKIINDAKEIAKQTANEISQDAKEAVEKAVAQAPEQVRGGFQYGYQGAARGGDMAYNFLSRFSNYVHSKASEVICNAYDAYNASKQKEKKDIVVDAYKQQKIEQELKKLKEIRDGLIEKCLKAKKDKKKYMGKKLTCEESKEKYNLYTIIDDTCSDICKINEKIENLARKKSVQVKPEAEEAAANVQNKKQHRLSL